MPPASVSSQYTRTGWWKWAAGALDTGNFIGRRDDKPPHRGELRGAAGTDEQISSRGTAICPAWRGFDQPGDGKFPGRRIYQFLLARLQVDRSPDRVARLGVAQHERRIGGAGGAEFGLAGGQPVAGAVHERAQLVSRGDV